RRPGRFPASAHRRRAGAGPVGAVAAAARVAAVLRRVPAARDHGGSRALVAGALLRRRAQRHQPAGGRPAGDRRCALLGRADAVAGVLHGLRRRAACRPARPRLSRAPACHQRAGAGRQRGAQRGPGRVRGQRRAARALDARRHRTGRPGRRLHRDRMGDASTARSAPCL
ncbi:MAG: hypothetical protein AVDCRST_MAG51-2490, partial [uncultured Ramlibacter sp.]